MPPLVFSQEAVGDFCVMDSCVGELAQAIVTIFGTRLLQAPINQLLVVQVTRMCFGANRAGMRATEKEFHMAPHSEVDIIGDYNSLAINFGFATLFGSVVPVAPLILFVSTFFEIRIDGYRLLMECRRPAPTGRQDIGSWYPIFSALSFAAVFTNAALVFVTGNYFDWLAGIKKLAAAAIACILVFAARMTYAYLIGGETAKGIDIQKQRRAHVIKKLIDKVGAAMPHLHSPYVSSPLSKSLSTSPAVSSTRCRTPRKRRTRTTRPSMPRSRCGCKRTKTTNSPTATTRPGAGGYHLRNDNTGWFGPLPPGNMFNTK